MAYTVLHLIDTTGPGGAEDVFIALATKIKQSDVDSIAVIRGEGYVADTLRKYGVEPVILDSKGSFNLGFLRALRRLIKRHNVKLIQSHLLGSNVYAAIIGWFTRTPVVATYHGMVDVSPNERFRAIKLWFMRKGISHFVAVSDSLKTAIETQQLLIPEKTSVVYNGIDLTLYSEQVESALKERLHISPHIPLIGALGNVRKSKRYDLLVEAAHLVHQKNIDVAFCIAGDPKASLKDPLDKMIHEYGLTNIHFIGFVADTPEYLRNLDGFILTSDAEGFSISTIEAMATGLPVIATRCGGPEEIIQDEAQGTLVNVSSSAIADAIETFVNAHKKHPNWRVKKARERVKDSFSEEAMLAQYTQIYHRIDPSFPQFEMEIK